MRKILLATTALIGISFAGAAQAAAPASPISLNVGGYNDFIAGMDNNSTSISGSKQVKRDFEDEFKISFDALGKAANGVEYGANISLWNGAEVTNANNNNNATSPWNGSANTVVVNSAYVWLSGAFGKLQLGDAHGATDLFVYAPTVGEGQIDGRYMDFVNSAYVAAPMIRASGFDNTEHSTKITYYTPKVGNDTNKVQIGLSYAPQLYDYGQSIIKSAGNTSTSNTISPYQDIVEGVAQYTGNFKPVNVTAALQWVHGGNSHQNVGNTAMFDYNNGGAGLGGYAKSFNTLSFGTQVAFDGVTLGGSYNRMGDYNTVQNQNRQQSSFDLGAKYEFDKVGVAASYLHGKGYDNLLNNGTGTTSATNYVTRYNAFGAGATYTWFPGLTSNFDGVFYNQNVADETNPQGGYTLLVSQRLAF